MSKKMNRVAGVVGIGVYKANFNADFEGNPRNSNGVFDASHASLKYPIRQYLNKRGHKIYYLKEVADKNYEYLEAKERYEKIFDTKLSKDNKGTVVKNLLSSVDVHNFGATFAESKKNVGISGAVQITEGINIYEDAEIDRTALLNPFINSKKDNKSKKEDISEEDDSKKEKPEQTTMGSRAVLNEAHFVFGFTVNPDNYDHHIGIIDGFDGYSEEYYQLFKEASLNAVTEYQSVAKAGCENEFAIFVNLKQGSLACLANLQNYVSFAKEDKIGVFDLSRLVAYINRFANEVENVEIYYNEIACKFEGLDELNCELIKKSILDRSEIE